jgi:hypothetical protein
MALESSWPWAWDALPAVLVAVAANSDWQLARVTTLRT